MKARGFAYVGIGRASTFSQQISVACLIVVRRSRSQAPVIGRHSAVVKPWCHENVLKSSCSISQFRCNIFPVAAGIEVAAMARRRRSSRQFDYCSMPGSVDVSARYPPVRLQG